MNIFSLLVLFTPVKFPIIQTDSDDEIIIPLEFEVATEEVEETIGLDEPVIVVDEIGRDYPGVLLEKSFNEFSIWGMVRYEYEVDGEKLIGYTWQPSNSIFTPEQWAWAEGQES